MSKNMKNKCGFTLIELLAVIIVLSLIAVIATPAIIDVIDDSKITTKERSVDLFAKNFRTALSDNELKGNIITSGSFSTDDGHTFTEQASEARLTVKYNGDAVICDEIELYEDGSLYIAGCTVGDYELSDYSYGTKQGES